LYPQPYLFPTAPAPVQALSEVQGGGLSPRTVIPAKAGIQKMLALRNVRIIKTFLDFGSSPK